MLTQLDISTETLGASDINRICPIFAGPTLIDGNALLVRRPDREISIKANRSLLRRIFLICDGTRSISELIDIQTTKKLKSETEAFISFLLANGALIDSSRYVLESTRYALGNNSFGLPAQNNLSDNIARRFAFSLDQINHNDDCSADGSIEVPNSTFTELLTQRQSYYRYGNSGVTKNQLVALLWSMHGVTKENRFRGGTLLPRRTIASAGSMHLLDIYVAIIKPVPGIGLEPGVFRIDYLSDRKVNFCLVSDSIDILHRSVTKPWMLDTASGVVFITANAELASLRYRNRSIQYLYTEAGMALQNGVLSAAESKIAFTIFGSYYEEIVHKLCNTAEQLILGCGIFGTKPTTAFKSSKECTPEIEFAWAETPSPNYTLPFYVGRSKNKHDPLNKATWGRDSIPNLAWRKSLAESIERTGYTEPKNTFISTYDNTHNAVDPTHLFKFHENQYKEDFQFKKFNKQTPLRWVLGNRHTDGMPVAMMADLVYSSESLRRTYGQVDFFCRSTSSGCAAGATERDAKLAALLELVERDAFMRHWMSQKPGQEILPETLPILFKDRITALLATGCRVSIQQMDSLGAPALLLIAQNDALCFTCIGAGCKLTVSESLNSALVELESRVFTLLNGHSHPRLTPELVDTPDDHFSIYAQPEYFRRADIFFTANQHITYKNASTHDVASELSFFDNLSEVGINPIYVDITPTLNGLQGSDERLSVIRAFAPGLIPLSFGYNKEPFGMMNQVHADAYFPHPFP